MRDSISVESMSVNLRVQNNDNIDGFCFVDRRDYDLSDIVQV